MNFIGIFGIILGLISIIYLSLKRVNPIIAAPLSTLIIVVFNRMPILESLVGESNSFMSEVGAFLVSNFAIFLLGAILAKYMERSGATVSIANYILNKVGVNNPYAVLVALFFISAFLTYGGISMFVVCFALVPMARPIFKRLDLPWSLVTVPIFAGISTFTLSMLPGSPASSNFIPSNTLKTPLTAAPLIGVVASLVVIIYTLFYIRYALNKVRMNQEGYVEGNDTETVNFKKSLPGIIQSVIPIFTLIILVITFSNYEYIVLIALTVSIILCSILFSNNLDNQLNILNEGSLDSVIPTFATACTVAFGVLLTSAPTFIIIQNSIQHVSSNPLISLSLTAMILSFTTGSGVGAVGIIMNNFANYYLSLGVSKVLLHRVTAIASGTFGAMPHTGLVITFNNIAKMGLRETYKYQFMTTNVGAMLGLVVALIMSHFM